MTDEQAFTLRAAVVAAVAETLPGRRWGFILTLHEIGPRAGDGDMEVLSNIKPKTAVPTLLEGAADLTRTVGKTGKLS